MNRFKHAALTAITLVGLALSSTASAGIVWREAPPGAGELTSTAQLTKGDLGSSLDSIQGRLNTTPFVNGPFLSEVDVFSIYINDFSRFSARTVSSNSVDDTALFLFDSAGKGVYSNDDNESDFLSTLPRFLTGGPLAGFYFIAVAIGGFSALDEDGKSLFLTGNFPDLLGPDSSAGTLARWKPEFPTLTDAGLSYNIQFTGARVAVVPEPTTALLVLLALGGLVATRSRRRSRQA